MNRGTLGLPIDLFNGIDGRKTGDGRTVLFHRTKHVLNNFSGNQRTNRVVHQNYIVVRDVRVRRGNRGQCVGDGLLALLTTLNQLDTLLKNIGVFLLEARLKTRNLRVTQGNPNFVDSGSRDELAQRVHENGRTREVRKLLGKCGFLARSGMRGHAGAEACGR